MSYWVSVLKGIRKQWLSISLVFMLGSILITGCGVKKTETGIEKGVTTIRWCADNNPIRKQQIAVFEKENPDIKVKLDWASVGLQKVLTQIAGGTPPDLFMLYSIENLIAMAQKGVLEDLTPYCQKYNIDLEDFWPQLKPYIYYEDKAYGFPDGVGSWVLFYNKRLLDEAGVPYPDEKWTWNDLLQAAQKLTKKDSSGRYSQFGLLCDDFYPFIFSAFIWQNGGRIYTPDGKKCIVNSREAVEAIQFLYDLRFKYHVSPRPAEMQSLGTSGSFGAAAEYFGAGKIAMYTSGRWRTITFRKYNDLDWSFAPLPRMKKRITVSVSHTTCMAKGSRHKEAAFKFLKFLIDKGNALIVINRGEGIPCRKSLSYTKEFLFNPEYPEEDNNQLYLDDMHYARPYEVSPYVSQIEVNRIFSEETDCMWAEQLSPKEALEKVALRVNRMISEGMSTGR